MDAIVARWRQDVWISAMQQDFVGAADRADAALVARVMHAKACRVPFKCQNPTCVADKRLVSHVLWCTCEPHTKCDVPLCAAAKSALARYHAVIREKRRGGK